MASINDDFADAIEVTIATDGGTYTSASHNTEFNTTEPDEPAISASADVSAWWKYTPSSSGTADFDTSLSTPTSGGTDTYMAIWTGTNFGDMVNVASNDDGGGSGTSLVSDLAVTGGTTYWVQIGGFGLQTMNVVLRVTGPATSGGGGTPVDLTPADSAHGHTSESPALTQAHSLTPADSAHAHAAESPALTQAHSLAPSDSAHGHTADSPALTQAHVLTPADSRHSHGAESPTLTQVHALTPADSTHAHGSESPTVSTGLTLVPDSSTHGHTADTPAVTQVHELAPADSSHGHATEAPTLTQVHVLAPADSLHAHMADSPAIVVPTGLPPPAERLVVVPAEDRTIVVPAESRTLTVPAESRTLPA